jgi:hypothetical protein
MQFIVIGDIEDADVEIRSRDASKVAPLALTLQFLRTGLLLGLKQLGAIHLHMVRDVHVHSNLIQHCDLLLPRVVA